MNSEQERLDNMLRMVQEGLRHSRGTVGSTLRSNLFEQAESTAPTRGATALSDLVTPPVHPPVREPLRKIVPQYLNRYGNTFLDAEFAERINLFQEVARRNGLTLGFESAYRSPAYQQHMRKTGQGITPAQNSLHSAGLAIDVKDYRRMTPAEQQIVRDAAREAGLSWGGDFRNPDVVHFYMDPGGDRRALIESFGNELQRLGPEMW